MGFIGYSLSILHETASSAGLYQWDRARLQLRQMKEIERLLPAGQNRPVR